MEELDLRKVLRLGRRWWWLLLLAPIVAGVAARFAETSIDEPATSVYSAKATLLINPLPGTGDLDYSLATYASLVVTKPVLNAVIQELALPFDVDALREMVEAEPVADDLSAVGGYTELLTVTVSDSEAVRAAAIANSVARHFTSYVGQQAAELNSSSRVALDQQIAETKQQIDQLTEQIQTLEAGPDAADPAVQTQIGIARANLSQLSESYANLLYTANTMDFNAAAAQSQVTIVEQADVPARPEPDGRDLPLIPIGAAAGLVVAIAAVLLLEYLDYTVRAGTNFGAVAGSSLLSAIPTVAKLRSGSDQLFVTSRPRSDAAEAIRLLRTNLEFAGAIRPLKSIALTSPGYREGKSTIAANLAVAIAQTGTATVLIDADLRHPSLHRFFGMTADQGLTTILTHPDQPWHYAATQLPGLNLTVVPTGPLLANPSDLLSLDRLRPLLARIGKEVEVIVVDAPPVLPVSDSLAIAASVDGVVLVSRAGRTRVDALARAAAALHHGAIRLLGNVVNQQSKRDDGDYGYTLSRPWDDAGSAHQGGSGAFSSLGSVQMQNGRSTERVGGRAPAAD